MEIILKVDGMMCGHCKANVENTLAKFEGVSAVADLETKNVTINAPEGTDVEKLKAAIVEEGYEIID